MPAQQTHKFGDDVGFTAARSSFPRTYIRLDPSVRVLGLMRKSKNGTRFRIQGNSTAGKGQTKPWLEAVVVRTSKDGVVTAMCPSTNCYFDINTKDTVRWPHAGAN
jgi:hypothetical protein